MDNWIGGTKVRLKFGRAEPLALFPQKNDASILHVVLAQLPQQVLEGSLYLESHIPTPAQLNTQEPYLLPSLLCCFSLHLFTIPCTRLSLPLVMKSSEPLLQRGPLIKEEVPNGSMASHLHERVLQAQKHQGRGRGGGQVRPCL